MFEIKKENDTAIITIDSTIERSTIEEIEEFKIQCIKLQDEGIFNIILNMEQVENPPSIFLGTIIVLQNKFKNSEGNIAIASPTERIRKIFEITKMDRIIGIYPTQAEALNSLHAKVR